MNPPRPSKQAVTGSTARRRRGDEGTSDIHSSPREQSEIRREVASETVCFLDRFSHGVRANSESAHACTLKQYKRQRQPGFERVQVKASHRITSHRIASHRIVSYRHSPWGHRRVTPPFLPFT